MRWTKQRNGDGIPRGRVEVHRKKTVVVFDKERKRTLKIGAKGLYHLLAAQTRTHRINGARIDAQRKTLTMPIPKGDVAVCIYLEEPVDEMYFMCVSRQGLFRAAQLAMSE